MADRFHLEVTHRDQFFSFSFDGEVGLGRQLSPAEPFGKLYPHPFIGENRIAIAPFSEVRVSRRQLLLRPTDNGIEVLNPSTNSIVIDDAFELPPNGQHLIDKEGRIAFGPSRLYQVRVWLEKEDSVELHTLPHEAPVPGNDQTVQPADMVASLNLSGSKRSAVGAQLASIVDVLQSAAVASDFLERAAKAVIELMSVDSAHVMLLESGRWRSHAAHYRNPIQSEAKFHASRRMLERMRAERRAIWSESAGAKSGEFSQSEVMAVVCAPICNRAGDVIGAVYAERRWALGDTKEIGPAEAKFAEVLAYTIAAGLERQRQEREAVDQRVRFEQFFGRELAEQLARDPEILTGKDAIVTMLAADIRGFSAISERLGANRTLQWIQDMLEALTEVVMNHGGVVVDYIGDEIMAMWGAPVAQQDQARRACQAALEMQVALGPLNARWQSRLETEIQVAIGIHTGTAQVGNIGSRRKFKYGALGHTVNLASRVQGANKHLRTSLLITKATHDALGSGFLTRRLGSVQVVNIEQPVEVYELRLMDDERGRILCQLYEKALGEFEGQQFRRAARTLGDYLPNYEDDGPSHILLWRAVNGLVEPEETFQPAWKLAGK
jgi:adenylate cyclase